MFLVPWMLKMHSNWTKDIVFVKLIVDIPSPLLYLLPLCRGLILQILELCSCFPTSESFASSKRSGARGFHEGIFDQGFGGFSTLKKRGGSRLEAVRAAASRLKRRPEMTSRGIHGDAFTGDIVDLQ